MAGEFDFLYEDLGGRSRNPDEAQFAAITKKDNTVVSAGAGSGKTEVLALRYAALLLGDESLHVKNILALTFTKKAASEIYARIYKKLTLFALFLNEGKYPKQVALAKRALLEFADARIQTLDSYSGSVVRLACNRYGIRPDFTTGSSSADRLAQDAALPFVLKHRNESCFDVFAKAGKIEDFAQSYFVSPVLQCTSVATKTGFFLECFNTQTGQIVNVWNDLFDTENEDSLVQLFSHMGRGKEVEVVRISKDSFFDSTQYALLLASCKKNRESVTKVCLLDMRRKENKMFSECIKQIKAQKESVFAVFDFVQYFHEQKRMFELLDEFLEEVNSAKRLSGSLSFKDVTDLALRILIEQPDIRRQQKSLIKKIMIDEFQDNNGGNKNFLFLLSENDGNELSIEGKSEKQFFCELEKNISCKKLFFVGDEKQSIYKFRGADVSVFNELKNSLKDTTGVTDSVNLRMTNNYRSSPALLSSFNVMFGSKQQPMNDAEMPSIFFSDQAVKSYDASYDFHATKNGESLPQLDSMNVAVHACVLYTGKNSDGESFAGCKKDDCLSPAETEAYFIAKKIADLCQKDSDTKASDFAILENSRTNRFYLTKYLSKFGIPFMLDQQTKIFSEGIANDFYNFLRLCVYPFDSNSFAAFLSSPFAGVSVQGVQNILASCTKKPQSENRVNSVFSPFSEEEDIELSASDAQKYQLAKEFFLEQRDRILSQKITVSLDFLWRESGYYFETLLSNNLSLYAEQYDLLYEIARQAENDGKSVAWLVDQLAVLKKKEAVAALGEESEIDFSNISYPLEKPAAVKIMTIHQSKGLEFPYVFVRGIFNTPKTESAGAFFFDENGFDSFEPSGVSLKTREGGNYFFLRQKDDFASRELAELKRKIYVAVTRAQRGVFIVGSVCYSEKLKAFDESIKCEKQFQGSISLMHKLLRFYYHSKLYEDNDFSSFECEQLPLYNDGAPFDLIKILPVCSDVRMGEKNDIENLRTQTIERFSALYEGTAIEEKEDFPQEFADDAKSPSSLELSTPTVHTVQVSFNQREFLRNEHYSDLDSLVVNVQSGDDDDSVISVFTAADFGTLTHAILQHFFETGDIPQSYNFIHQFISKSIARKIDETFSEKKKKQLYNIAQEMARSFIESVLGRKALSAKKAGRLCKCENKFKLFHGGTIFTGSIDLIFCEENGTHIIVDYKTDAKVEPEIYIEQQKIYRLAAAEIYNTPLACVKTYLYYLRFDRGLDISEFTMP